MVLVVYNGASMVYNGDEHMKLYVDDKLQPPNESWKLAKNYDEAIEFFRTHLITVLDLDYDLGEFKTGLDVLLWIERQLYEKKMDRHRIPSSIKIHSASIENRLRMQQRINAIHGYLNRSSDANISSLPRF